MITPRVLVLTGYGINCDGETKFAFETAGAKADIVHINDLIDGKRELGEYQILALPGGFSYGDDTGSGNALANRMRNHLWDEVRRFVEGDHLAIGICNGFQVMVNLGLLPALDGKYGERSVALVHNDSARYVDRWVDVQFEGNSPWVAGITGMSVPIAHGEGKFYATTATLARLRAKSMVAARYVTGEICNYQHLAANPNGSLDDIAGITDESGRILGLMPHPERALDFTHLPTWTEIREKYRRERRELPSQGPGLKIFENAVAYFQ